MLSSFDAGQSELSSCTIWLRLYDWKKKEMLKEGGGRSPMDRPLPLSYLFNLQKAQPL